MPAPDPEVPRLAHATAAAGRPGLLVAACLLVLVEAATVSGLAVAFGIGLAQGSGAAGAVLFLLVFLVAIGAVLGLSARGLWRGRRWARSPILTWQLLLVALALGWIGVEPTWWAVGLVVVAVAVGVLLLLPPVVAVTTGRATDAR